METSLNFIDLENMPRNFYRINVKQENLVKQSYRRCLEAEKNLLEMSGIQIGKDYEISNVALQRNSQYLHAYKSLNTQEGKKKLILLHGYGMNGLAYMKMLQPLMQKYEVHCLHLPGMGLSSREDFSSVKGEQETIDYFVQSLEAYRKVNNISKFTMAAHSFGGYMGANYALQYPQHIDNLVLLSPLGSTYRSSESIKSIMSDIIDSIEAYRRPLFKYYYSLFSQNVTLTQLKQKWYLPFKTLLSHHLNRQMKLQDKEQNQYFNFIKNNLNLPESSERGLYNIIKDKSAYVKSPLEHTFPGKMPSSVPIHFLYGDQDWMDYAGAYKLFRKQKEYNLNVKFHILPHARHQVVIDNPSYIINYLLNL